MTKLIWDKSGERFYETGIKECALYPQGATGAYETGVAWNGITGVTESPGGAEATDLYADDTKYGTLRSAETFGATIEAYTYPDEFGVCDGSAEPAKGIKLGQQPRRSFGLAYKTSIGSDTSAAGADYKLHLIYNATAAPSEKAYATINDSPEAITFSWELTTTPVPVTGFSPVASLVIDSRYADKEKLAVLEGKLFGSTDSEPKLLLPDEIIEIFGDTTTGSEVIEG